MRPTFAIGDLRDGRPGNAEAICNVAMVFPLGDCLPDGAYFVGRKSRLAVYLSQSVAFLCYLVVGIDFGSTQKEVRRVDARRVVALMANVHTFRDWAKRDFVTETMSRFVASRAVALTSDMHDSVAQRGSCSMPNPTIVDATALDFFPEAFFDGARDTQFRVMAGKKAPSLTTHNTSSLVMPRDEVCRLSTTALAEALWFFLKVLAGIVPTDEANGLPFYDSPSGVGMCSDGGALPATAMTVAVGDYLRRFWRGMLIHVDTLLSEFGHAAGRYQRRRGAFIGNNMIVTQNTPRDSDGVALVRRETPQ